MEIVITIKETKDGAIANIKADFSLSFESVKDAENWSQEFLKNPKDLILCKLVSAEDAAHFFASIEDTEKRAESWKSDIERMEIECDCPKCMAEREALEKNSIRNQEPIHNTFDCVHGDVYGIENNSWVKRGL